MSWFNAANYEQAKSLFRIDVPDQFNFGFDIIDRHAEDERKRALVWTDSAGRGAREYTFRDIARFSNQAANALKDRRQKRQRYSSCSAAFRNGIS